VPDPGVNRPHSHTPAARTPRHPWYRESRQADSHTAPPHPFAPGTRKATYFQTRPRMLRYSAPGVCASQPLSSDGITIVPDQIRHRLRQFRPLIPKVAPVNAPQDRAGIQGRLCRQPAAEEMMSQHTARRDAHAKPEDADVTEPRTRRAEHEQAVRPRRPVAQPADDGGASPDEPGRRRVRADRRHR
jgi:hypothetical protein